MLVSVKTQLVSVLGQLMSPTKVGLDGPWGPS